MKEVLSLTLLALLLVGCSMQPGAAVADDVQNNESTNPNHNNGPSERTIRMRISEAQVCATASDCVEIASVCPYGCHIAVNKDEAAQIQELIDSYESACTYKCAPVDRIDCVANKCMSVIGETPSDDGGS